MADTDPEAENEALRLRQEILVLQAEIAGLRAPPPPPPSPSSGPLAIRQPSRGGLGRRLVFAAYGLVRPVLRPIAWRLRSFLIGPVLEALAEQRTHGAHPFTAAGGSTLDPAMAKAIERLLLTLAVEERGPR